MTAAKIKLNRALKNLFPPASSQPINNFLWIIGGASSEQN
jgi:hypothetical protein